MIIYRTVIKCFELSSKQGYICKLFVLDNKYIEYTARFTPVFSFII